jgi:F420-dependent oxidoreductase-like protein
MLEAYATLSALSQRTSRVRLSALVTGVTYRNPALLAKIVTTLDVLSGGRALLGIGAAWNEEEHRAYGFDFPPIRERMDRLEEALTIIRAMFREETATFHGRYYRVEGALNEPRPLQPGGPRVMVGGGGEQRTLRIAAKHADMTHWFPVGLDALQRKKDVLQRYCDEIGRDPATIELTMATPAIVSEDEQEARELLDRMPRERRAHVTAGPPERAAEGLRPYIDAGFTGFTFNDTVLPTRDAIARAGKLLTLVT